jgi:hypothetical protein
VAPPLLPVACVPGAPLRGGVVVVVVVAWWWLSRGSCISIGIIPGNDRFLDAAAAAAAGGLGFRCRGDDDDDDDAALEEDDEDDDSDSDNDTGEDDAMAFGDSFLIPRGLAPPSSPRRRIVLVSASSVELASSSDERGESINRPIIVSMFFLLFFVSPRSGS